MPPHTMGSLIPKSSPSFQQRVSSRHSTRHGSPPDSSEQLRAELERDDLVADGMDTAICMPTSQFKSSYLTPPSGVGGKFSSVFPDAQVTLIHQEFKKPFENGKKPLEKDLYEAWSAADKIKPLLPNHFFHVSPDKPDLHSSRQDKPDASFIPTDEALPAHDPGRANFRLLNISVEFKRGSPGADPFDDSDDPDHEKLSSDRLAVRGQLMAYTLRVFRLQFREAHFQLFVNGRQFRFLRWDKSGVVVTDPEDYVTLEGTRKLLRMLYDFSCLDRKGQGYDTTVKLLPSTSSGWQQLELIKRSHPFDVEAYPDAPVPQTPLPPCLSLPWSAVPQSLLFKRNFLRADPLKAASPKAVQILALARDGDRVSTDSEYYEPTYEYIRSKFAETLGDGALRYVMHIGKRLFLVGDPVFHAFGVVGRGTKGFFALDWLTQRIVFVKDTWQPFYSGLESEGAVLKRLNEKNVRFVPTHICHEDYVDQETETSNYGPTGSKRVDFSLRLAKTQNAVASSSTPAAAAATPGAARATRSGAKRTRGDVAQGKQGAKLRHFRHHRLAVFEVCLPSTAFKDGRMWTLIVFAALCAHRDAVKLCEIVHRDVSVGNILVCPQVSGNRLEWEGKLSDWELCKTNVPTVPARQPIRTGTYQFQPIICLKDPETVVGVAEELESFFYVFLYNAVCLLDHNLPDVHEFVSKFFDDNSARVPMLKMSAMDPQGVIRDSNRVELEFEASGGATAHPINSLIDELLQLFQARYQVLKYDDDLRAYRKKLSALQSQQEPLANDAKTNSDDVELVNSDTTDEPDAAAKPPPSQVRILADELAVVPRPTRVPRAKEPKPPGQDVSDLAARLDDHAYVIGLFKGYLLQNNWPAKDRLPESALRGDDETALRDVVRLPRAVYGPA
ncbi:uncharacterized protein BXZ73DRAFT_106834 [Epithele typhae]|uniref:uncharacterized protein n=1 Tax=Epithele typhae TaxID=378194 RepID=UPI002007D37E|nr:uncharacterized protein BXZ73DRAFT_106834 [Epithele typhae]KAH9913814.1 hypothetical protein BXZ73DRAFT_106834 [Epithele typhae]